MGGSPCACEERALDEETVRACEILRCFFWPLAQILGIARIRLSHNHLGPQINGLLLRVASRSSGQVFVMNTQTDRQTDNTFALIYRMEK